MKRPKIDMRPSGWLMLSLLYFFGDLPVVAALAGSIVLHEWGHAAALRCCGCRVRCIRIDLTGLCMDYRGPRLTGPQEFFVAAAGPGVGALAAWIASFVGNWYQNQFLLLFAGTSLILTGFNLIPACPLDGWRMLRSVSDSLAERMSFVTASGILFLGIWCFWQGYGTGMVVMGLILLLQDGGWTVRKGYTVSRPAGKRFSG